MREFFRNWLRQFRCKWCKEFLSFSDWKASKSVTAPFKNVCTDCLEQFVEQGYASKI